MKKNAIKHHKFGKSLFIVMGMILLIVYTASFLAPLLWALMTSFKSEMDFMRHTFGFPTKFIFDNYAYVFQNMAVPVSKIGNIYIVEMFYNSICYTVLCTFTHTLTPLICAYAVAKFDFKFGKVIYGIVIVTMILPVIGNLASEIQRSVSTTTSSAWPL